MSGLHGFYTLNTTKDIHIGKEIKQKLEERQMSITDFAQQIHCNRSNVYSIFSRSSIDINQLVLISKVLAFDFITEIYLKTPPPQKNLVLMEMDNATLQQMKEDASLKIISVHKLSK